MAWEYAFPLQTFSCRCRSGLDQLFEVRVEGGFESATQIWFYYVRPVGVEITDDGQYEAHFKEVDATLLQLDWANNALPDQFQRCGITRSLIPVVAAHRQTRIRSSRNGPGETRSTAATRSWQRMVADGIASFDPVEDRYFYPLALGGAA